jgi:hypothetical protein
MWWLIGTWIFWRTTQGYRNLKNLLVSYNLKNTVNNPTRITSVSESLIDVIVTNREYPEQSAVVIDLGLSDHHAQLIRILSKRRINTSKIIVRRSFTSNRVEEFITLLSNESWSEVINQSYVHASLEAFLLIFLQCFRRTFPYKRMKLRERVNKRWLSKGLITSSNRIKVLKNLKWMYTLRREDLNYINNYQIIYKKILKEAKKKKR